MYINITHIHLDELRKYVKKLQLCNCGSVMLYDMYGS